MLVELRTKSQITIPKEIVKELGLAEGDKLDISVVDGVICMTPVSVYPKGAVENLASQVQEAQAKYNAGEDVSFDEMSRDIARLTLIHEVQRGIDDIEAGRVMPAEEMFQKLRRKYGK